MKVHGACHCGQISYEAEIDPEKVTLCNCTDCQMLSGTGYRVSVPADRATLRLNGEVKVYVKTAESGTKRRHGFCPHCGTPVYSAADSDEPPAYSLRIGCLAERAHLAPKRRIWCKSALDWAQNVTAVPALDRQ